MVRVVVRVREWLEKGWPILLAVAEQLGEHGCEGLIEALGHAVALRVICGGGALVDSPGLGDGAGEDLVEARPRSVRMMEGRMASDWKVSR